MPDRLDELKERVYSRLFTIHWAPMRQEALEHTMTVVTFCALLAEKRKLNPELAMTAGLLHDLARYTQNCGNDHAQQGAQLARTILMESRSFTPEEIELVAHAIACHSQKNQVDEPMDELLKDADVIARSITQPAMLLSVQRRFRLQRARAQLSLNGDSQA